ncbi:MAG: zinc ribbon domain-containing protein [Desulfarculaceae bacterium]|nr:zinc ribbon domain-containing protein [Desulfarculaceae bacterium]
MDEPGVTGVAIIVTIITMTWPFWLSGIISGIIAKSAKNRSFFGWFIYGCLLPIISQIHAICISKNISLTSDIKKCPYCGEIIKREATVCKHCRKEMKPTSVIERNN